MYERYGQRKLWLTEYSIGRWKLPSPSREEQDAYLKATLPLLENHPYIARYVWFSSRGGYDRWNGVKDLVLTYEHTPMLTSTGKIYKNWPESVNENHQPTIVGDDDEDTNELGG